MKKLIILLALFAFSCSQEEDIKPLIDKDYSLNSGKWANGNLSFVADGKIIKDYNWSSKNPDKHHSSYVFFGDSLRVKLRENGRANYHLDIVLNWDLGANKNHGYLILKGGIGKSDITFFKE